MDIRKKLKKYLDDNLKSEKRLFSIARAKQSIFQDKYYDMVLDEEEEINMLELPSGASSINNFIDNELNDNKFQKLLFKYIDERNLKDSDVYNKVHIDRRLFSKIRNDNNYHPSKETIILLGLSLELDEHEIEELLNSAAYSLPKNNYYDLIIRFCFINKIYKLTEVNSLLDEYHCKLFDY
jgi:hypothetical protein